MNDIFLYEKEVDRILKDNNAESAKEMYNRINSKLDLLTARMNKVTLYLILCVCIYALTSEKDLLSVSIGPFGFSNFELISKAIPVVFAYFCLEYALSSSHQRQLVEVCKQLIKFQFNDNPCDEIKPKGNYVSFLSNMLLPFSLLTQISRLTSLKAASFSGGVLLLLYLPMMFVFFIPVFIQGYLLVDLWQRYNGDGWAKASVAVSVWFFLLIIIYYVRHTEHDFASKKINNNS